jgi:hypothetical protein
VVVLAISWALFVPAADWIATHDVGHVTGALRTLRLQTAQAARGRLLRMRPDIQAAITVIERRDIIHDSMRIDLTGPHSCLA